jgi:hypothetical protein
VTAIQGTRPAPTTTVVANPRRLALTPLHGAVARLAAHLVERLADGIRAGQLGPDPETEIGRRTGARI